MGSRIAAVLAVTATAIVAFGLWAAGAVGMVMARFPILTR